MLPFPEFRIVLASQSPRRRLLLEQAGLPFVVRAQDIPEDFPAEMPVEEVAEYLARKKAAAAMHHLERKEDVILTADSVVILDGEFYGKPADAEESAAMLRRLSGREHTVITGVCLRTATTERAFSDIAKVKFAELTDEEITYYVARYQPFDKAGSYAIQEWIGLCKIERIQGTYANIMGLPVQRVYAELLELFG
ncbi:MAG: septum formation protein Maf [Lewinella sp.]|nr:septum formation protein Maf [Lewinella sp.]